MMSTKIISLTLYLFLLVHNGYSQDSPLIVHICDTTGGAFYKKIKPAIQKTAKLDNEIFLNLYEGEQGYEAAYSFIYWVKEGKHHSKLFSVKSYDGNGKIRYRKTSNIIDTELKIDILLDIFKTINQVQADTNTMISHDHLFIAEIWYKKRRYVYKFCFSQLSKAAVDNKEYLLLLLKKIRY